MTVYIVKAPQITASKMTMTLIRLSERTRKLGLMQDYYIK